MVFAGAIAALFADPHLAKSAAYLSKGNTEPKSVRVITKQPDTVTSFSDARLHSSTNLFDVQSVEVSSPQIGDKITLDGTTYQVQSEPVADSERLIWTLDVVIS